MPVSTLKMEVDDGIATLSSLGPVCISELEPKVQLLRNDPAIDIVVLDRLRFFSQAVDGSQLKREQELLLQFANAPFVSLALIEGKTIGLSWEAALASDYRLAVAAPDTLVGFGSAPRHGGSLYFRRVVGRRTVDLNLFAPREAVRLGLLDDAFTPRRKKIELRTFLDRLQKSPRKRPPRRNWFGPTDGELLAAERRGFSGFENVPDFTTPFVPRSLGVAGSSHDAVALVAAAALREIEVAWSTDAHGRQELKQFLASAIAQGQTTPLEAKKAEQKVTTGGDEVLHRQEIVFVVDRPESGLAFLEIALAPGAHLAILGAFRYQSVRKSGRAARVETGNQPWTVTSGNSAQRIAELLTRLGFPALVGSSHAARLEQAA